MNWCGKKRSPALIGAHPFFEHLVLDAPHGLHLGNASVGNAVHVPRQQLRFVGRSQVAVVRNALVEVMRDQIEHIFFQIGAGAADAVNLVLAYHLRQRKPQLGCAHGSADGHEHFAASGNVFVVGFGRVNQCGGIEMAIVVLDKGVIVGIACSNSTS
jgi:hypothetical protein